MKGKKAIKRLSLFTVDFVSESSKTGTGKAQFKQEAYKILGRTKQRKSESGVKDFADTAGSTGTAFASRFAVCAISISSCASLSLSSTVPVPPIMFEE
eukprot:UN00337